MSNSHRIVAEISTHIAIVKEGEIKLYIKELRLDDMYFPAEFMYGIPLDHEDDVLSIMERLEENNRVNLAEMSAAFAA